MTLDEYVTWAAGVGKNQRAGVPEDSALREAGLMFASKIGKVAGIVVQCLRDDERWRDELADELGDVAYHWALLCVVTGVAPSALLARSRAHVEWRRAGRPAGGPVPGAGALTLEEYAAWAVEAVDTRETAGSDGQALVDVGLALVEDAGEVVECLRKLAREGDGQRERLAGELGDVWRYWTRLCVASGNTPADLLMRSRSRIERCLARGTKRDGGASQ
jgi:NTP pyrophosphatase (non-canonical NTP hydrolase)